MTSLFKSIEWWGMQTTSEEECDFGCLCVANIDNSADGTDKIIVGSYHGILHIYLPSEGGKNPHDILLESQLSGPILQVAAGKFVSVSSDLHLAVLLPRSLTIYAIAVKAGAVDHGNQCIINKIYEHRLERTAANMTYGPFGGVQGKDSLCVQSMDGTLSVFESENFAFTRFIPGFLTPGPLAYNARIDSFITMSSNRCLEAYSYQVLAVAVDSNTKEESQSVTTGKRINADWKLNLGEGALDISVINIPNSPSVIMILGERNLFCVHETGQLAYMKKLDYNPSCFYPFIVRESSTVNCIVCTHTKQLLLYEGITLKWASLLSDTPVQVAVGTIGKMPGMLITLTDQCNAACSYLGTHPSVFNLPQSAAREPDYATIDQEMQKINNKIKELHMSKGDALSQAKESEDLTVKVNVPPAIDKVSVSSEHATISSEGIVPSITVQIILKATRRVKDVSIMIHVDQPLTCTQKHIAIPAISESDPTPCATVSFFLCNEFSPSSLEFEVVVYYQQSVTGHPKVVTKSAQLPLSLVSWPHDPIKTMDSKITLESNKPCMNLLELFPELAAADAGPNCVGLRLIYGPRTTILTSKSSNRYRVQSESYAGLWLVTRELVKRLESSATCKLTHPQPVNLEELSPIIDRHYQLRVSKESVRQILDLRAKQFRAIQRRLLTRFKDKTPAPLNCLDSLLEGTYRQILALADACEENAQTLLMSNIELSCVLRLTILLARLWLELGSEEVSLLESVFCVHLRDADMGWEETVECSVSKLIRTVLSKGGKDSFSASMPPSKTTLELPDDVSKIKKYIGIFFDHLSKGARLIPQSSFKSINRNTGPISNISISKSKDSSPQPLMSKRGQPPPIARGVSDDYSAILEEDESAIIDDIMKSTPAMPSVLKPPSLFNSSIKEDNTAESIDEKPYKVEPKSEHENGVENPIGMAVKPSPSNNSDDAFMAGDDIIESPSFYDNTADDLYAM
uniref:protein PTHB1-like n=1 Tax=Styela clava TaxID=7725 RepID=UPI00193AB581|nr:protein PTHB1-like [Styela clava]